LNLCLEHFLKDCEQKNTKSLIYKDMIEPEWISKDYKESVKPAELVRDYLAGMTDRYFNNVFHRLVIPEVVTDFSKVPEWSKMEDKFMRQRIYIAGPLFSQGELEFNLVVDEYLKRLGFETFLPQKDGHKLQI